MTKAEEESGQSEALPEGENVDSGPVPQDSHAPAEGVDDRIEAARKEVEMYRDQLLRKAAEFENYKRRMEGEMRWMVENASERLIGEILPILDDLDRFLRSSKKDRANDALVQGVELISNKLTRVLSLRGLSTFESLGKPFDVQFHDALLQVPRADVPPHTVVEEVSRGYMLNGKVLRHAKVVVSEASAAPTENDAGTETETGHGEDRN